MIKQIYLLLISLLPAFVTTAQVIKKQSTDTSAYRANDRLRTSGPRDGWPFESGNQNPSGFWLTAQGGISSTSAKNLASYLRAKNGWLAGAGLELLLLDGGTGRIPVGVQYQFSVFSVEGMDPASGAKISNKLQLQYMKLPLQYQFYIDRSKRLFIGAGGYGALLVTKKQTGTTFNVDRMNNTEFGAMLSAGYSLSTRWVLQANAQWGITEMNQLTTGTQLHKNRFYFLSLSFSPFTAANGKPVYGPIIKIKPKG